MKMSAMTWTRISVAILAALSFSGCAGVALTALGVGASTGVSHTLGGITYRTFTEPMPKVRSAALEALDHMGIRVASSGKIDHGEMIKANAAERQIEIEFESISRNTTRMRAVAKMGGFLYDSATAAEIIYQTEKVLGNT